MFYLDDGNLVVLVSPSNHCSMIPPLRDSQVDSVIFRIHRSILKMHSRLFADMFALSGASALVEGTDDDHPLDLPFINSPEDFALILSFMYGQ